MSEKGVWCVTKAGRGTSKLKLVVEQQDVGDAGREIPVGNWPEGPVSFLIT